MPPPPFCVLVWVGSYQTDPLQYCLSVSEHSDTPPKLDWASFTLLTHTFSFMHALTHAGRTMLRQLPWTYTESETWQTGRLTRWYRLCFSRQSYCNWSAFQSLSFSRKNAIKADSICWISLTGRCAALSYATTNSGFRCALNTEIVFSLPPVSLEVSQRE